MGHVLYLLYEMHYDIGFAGNHRFSNGDGIRLVPHDNNGCEGAANPYRDPLHGCTVCLAYGGSFTWFNFNFCGGNSWQFIASPPSALSSLLSCLSLALSLALL